nr:MAG TPA: hypothetical protein [Caudoviricetes sp.]
MARFTHIKPNKNTIKNIMRRVSIRTSEACRFFI